MNPFALLKILFFSRLTQFSLQNKSIHGSQESESTWHYSQRRLAWSPHKRRVESAPPISLPFGVRARAALVAEVREVRKTGRGGEEGTGFDGVRARCVLLAPTLYSPATIAPKDGYTQSFNLANIR